MCQAEICVKIFNPRQNRGEEREREGEWEGEREG